MELDQVNPPPQPTPSTGSDWSGANPELHSGLAPPPKVLAQGGATEPSTHGAVVFVDELCAAATTTTTNTASSIAQHTHTLAGLEGRYVRVTGLLIDIDVNNNRVILSGDSEFDRVDFSADGSSFSSSRSGGGGGGGGAMAVDYRDSNGRGSGSSIAVDIQWIDPNFLRVGSFFQFWGYITVETGYSQLRGGVSKQQQQQCFFIKAKVARNVDGIDLALYRRAIMLQRKYLSSSITFSSSSPV